MFHSPLKVHKHEIFLAPILDFIIFIASYLQDDNLEEFFFDSANFKQDSITPRLLTIRSKKFCWQDF